MTGRDAGQKPRRLAAEVVARVLHDDAWVGPSLDAVLRREKDLPGRDRGLVTELAYGTVRWLRPLQHSLERACDRPPAKWDTAILPHLLVAAYQLQHLHARIPAHAAVNCAVSLIRRRRRHLAGFANAILRGLGSPLHSQLSPRSTRPEVAAAFGLPPFVVDMLADRVADDELSNAVGAFNARPSLHLIDHRSPRDETLALLERAGVAASSHSISSTAVVLDEGVVVERLLAENPGLCIQDAGSQLVGELGGARRGQRVLDLCAAPGMKALQACSAVGSQGTVVAVELHEARANRLRDNARRLEKSIDIIVGDARHVPLPGEWDVVIVDAPCSGLGTTRRHPETKLRYGEAAGVDDDLLNLQREILERATDLVRRGGSIVYSVCSPMQQEGVAQVRRAVATDEFAVISPQQSVPDLPAGAVVEDCLQLLPHLHDTDAFFAAHLRRRD